LPPDIGDHAAAENGSAKHIVLSAYSAEHPQLLAFTDLVQ
jgi:hypothetical protein